MSLQEVFRLIHSDYRRYRATGGNEGSVLGILLLSQGFWASTIYRLSHFTVNIQTPAFLRRLLRILFLFIEKGIEIITSIRIPGECTIGKGLYIGHFGTIIIHSQAIIGDYCNLSQGVTIGIVQSGEKKGIPVIGDRVYIGPNVIIIGGINIEDDVAIGAGAVVVKSIEKRSVVGGNPARVISQKGSFDFVKYDGMNNDPVRLASLQQNSGNKK